MQPATGDDASSGQVAWKTSTDGATMQDAVCVATRTSSRNATHGRVVGARCAHRAGTHGRSKIGKDNMATDRRKTHFRRSESSVIVACTRPVDITRSVMVPSQQAHRSGRLMTRDERIGATLRKVTCEKCLKNASDNKVIPA